MLLLNHPFAVTQPVVIICRDYPAFEHCFIPPKWVQPHPIRSITNESLAPPINRETHQMLEQFNIFQKICETWKTQLMLETWISCRNLSSSTQKQKHTNFHEISPFEIRSLELPTYGPIALVTHWNGSATAKIRQMICWSLALWQTPAFPERSTSIYNDLIITLRETNSKTPWNEMVGRFRCLKRCHLFKCYISSRELY